MDTPEPTEVPTPAITPTPLPTETNEAFVYNELNQLVSYSNGETLAEYSYLPNGLRKDKTVDGETTTHVWVGSNIVLELDSDGAVIDTYTRGINLIKSSDEYYLYNAHGDVVQLVDEDGTMVKDYRYDAFGVEKNPDNEDTNVWRFCGEYFDVESGLIYLRARYMSPETGRFLSEDTHWNTKNMVYGDNPQKIRESKDALGLNVYTYAPDINAVRQSGNLYAYGMSNPIMYQDPSGHVAILALVFISIASGMVAGTITGAVDSYMRYDEVRPSVMLDWTFKGLGLGSAGALGIASAGAVAAVGATAVAATAGGGIAFDTFAKLKNYLGSAGPGRVWHHIVEQCQGLNTRAGFSAKWIHNTNNIVNISSQIHGKISAFYSSVPTDLSFVDTGGKVFRNWLNTMSFEQQYEWGIRVMKYLGVKI